MRRMFLKALPELLCPECPTAPSLLKTVKRVSVLQEFGTESIDIFRFPQYMDLKERQSDALADVVTVGKLSRVLVASVIPLADSLVEPRLLPRPPRCANYPYDCRVAPQVLGGNVLERGSLNFFCH
jgi:hypothetical protein